MPSLKSYFAALAIATPLTAPAFAVTVGADAGAGRDDAMRAAERAVPGAQAIDAAMSEQCGKAYWLVAVHKENAQTLVLEDERAQVLRVVAE